MKKLVLAAVLAVVGVVGAATAGCSSASVSDACENQCSCSHFGCTPKSEAGCETQGYEAQEAASDLGCGSAYDDLLSCEASATCGAIACESESVALERCEAHGAHQSTGSFGSTGGTGGSHGGSTGQGSTGQGSTGHGSTGHGSTGHGATSAGHGSTSAASGGAPDTICQRAWDHFEACEGNSSSSLGGECDAHDACLSACTLAGACDLWTGGASDAQVASYDDCNAGCGD
jgi:hypothetical protein